MSPVQMVKKRAGWLVVFLGEMLTVTAMGFFEKEIAKAVVLAFCPAHHLERKPAPGVDSCLCAAPGELKLRPVVGRSSRGVFSDWRGVHPSAHRVPVISICLR